MIYIQSHQEYPTLPHHSDCACALYGAIETCQNFRLTSFEEVASGKFDNLIKGNLFVGSVEFMREVFKRVGIDNPRVPANSNRPCTIRTLDEVRDLIINQNQSWFVKPLEIKLFTGLVLDKTTINCVVSYPGDTQCMVYEPFNEPIVSEWRIYVRNRNLEDSHNYSGDFTISPDYVAIKQHALVNNDLLQFPCSYTIDVGILESGRNVVIEYNDMWAIGNYGVSNYVYLKMLRERYFEIVRGNKYGI
jgi:hypothetical protein